VAAIDKRHDMIRITILWVLGIILLVPYALYRLLFVAQPDEYAFLIVFPLFWIFGYWGVVGPIFAAVKGHRLIRALEKAGDPEGLKRAFDEHEGDEVLIELIRTENRIPRWLARKIFDRVKPRLIELASTRASGDVRLPENTTSGPPWTER
jgi:hypothetical protein